jgi:AcrR family transcriptional regulator
MPDTSKPTRSTPKAEATQTRILDSALDLFRRRGYDQATMRDIAAEAGVSLGSAYYYFESKADLVMAFYERASIEMGEPIVAAMAGGGSLEERLHGIMAAKFAYFLPNRAFLGALFRYAADPQDRLSPFSVETRHIRERDQGYFQQALEASKVDAPKDLAPHLPKLLWLYQMGLILYWIYDRSPEQHRTRALLAKSLAFVVSGLKLASFPLLRPLRKKIVELLLIAEGEEESHA